MLHQEKISERMRSVLIDWLIEVHFKFKLADETLYLTVNLIDRFLQSTQVAKENLQLVGVSSMLLACKYEEIYPPEVKDFVYITDNAYNTHQVLQTEGLILKALNFNLTVPSSFRFLQRFSRICELDEFSFNFARFALELSLVDYRFIRFRPSVLAVSAIVAAQRILKFACRELAEACKASEADVRTCSKEMVFVLVKSHNSNLQGTRKKFLSDKYLGVAKVEIRL
jgi:cyclin B